MVSLRLKYCIGAGLDGHIRPDLRVLRGVRLESYGCVRLTVLGCAAISLPLMPLFGIGMTKLGPRWNGDAFPGLCRRLGLCGWIRNTFPGMLRTMVRLAAFHVAGAATSTDFDDRTGVQQ